MIYKVIIISRIVFTFVAEQISRLPKNYYYFMMDKKVNVCFNNKYKFFIKFIYYKT